MILFAEQLDDFSSLTRSAYEEAKKLESKRKKVSYASMQTLLTELGKRYQVLERMNEHAHRDPEYFWKQFHDTIKV